MFRCLLLLLAGALAIPFSIPRLVVAPFSGSSVAWIRSAVAADPDPEALLREAERSYEQLEYEAALRTLIKVQQIAGITPIQRARAYLYMGVAFTALGRAENAVQAFVEVLKLRPSFRLPPGVSPSIRAMFGQAIQRLKLPEKPAPDAPAPAPGAAPAPAAAPPAAGTGVELVAKAPRTAVAGTGIPIAIEIDDPKRLVREVMIRWRRRQGPDYSTIRLEYVAGTTELKGTIPGAAIGPKSGRLAFFVEARDSKGGVLARAGTDEDPKDIELTGKAVEKKTKSNWGWWALGIGGATVAVAGGIVAAILIANAGTGPGDQAGVVITIE